MKIMTAMYTVRRGGAYDRFMMTLESFLERSAEVHCVSLTPIKIKHSNYHNLRVALPFGVKDDWLTKLSVLLIFPVFVFLAGWQKKIDLFIAFNLPYAFIQAIPKWILRRPMITFVRGDFTFGLRVRNSLKGLKWFTKAIEFLGLLASDRVLTVNRAIYCEILSMMGRSKKAAVEILYNNIQPATPLPFEDCLRVRLKYRIPEDARVLMTAGVLNRGKNIETLIRCLSSHALKDVYLLIAGDGSTAADLYYKESLKKLAKSLEVDQRVIFAGWLEKKELWKVYRASNLFALASLSEGMPNVLLEALGSDVPCLGSRIPGIEDILQHEELMFDPFDQEAIVNKVSRILENAQYSNYILGLCRERKEAFLFDWKERIFSLATQGIRS